MNTKTLMTIKTDKIIKLKAQKTAEELGFSLGTLVNAYLKQFVRTKRVDFSVESYIPNKKTARLLDKAMKDIQEGKNLSRKFTSVDDLMQDLLS
jgi:DNA-damage-inducible protein J